MSERLCAICGRVLADYEGKICDDCEERQKESFDDEEAYYSYQVGNDR